MSAKCPFCGVGLLTERVADDITFWQARCGICSARGPRSGAECEAIAAFTQPAHALRAVRARVEAEVMERVRACSRCKGSGRKFAPRDFDAPVFSACPTCHGRGFTLREEGT